MPDTVPVRWQSDAVSGRDRVPVTSWPMPSLTQALSRGFAGHCPACGRSPLFTGWLRVRTECPVCTAPLGSLRADDAPPYFTIFIVGHFIIGLMVILDLTTRMSVATELAIFLPATALMCAALLRPVKGATVGLMLRLRMETPPGQLG